MSTTQITIAGKVHTVPQPYEEGHVISAAEAAALNQTYAENLRNNLAPKVKAHIDAGTYDEVTFQNHVDEYAADYVFGFRPGRTADPVAREAMAIAKDKVKDAVRRAGYRLADVSSESITEKAQALLHKYPEIIELAKQRVAAAQELADIDLDFSGPKAKKSKSE
jgi:hypothetical protein